VTWNTDASGNPARRAPAHAGKPSKIYFDPVKFERAIQEHGDRLRWEQASRCPCAANDQTGSANPVCPVCGGAGWEYHSPLEIRGIVDRFEVRIDALEKLGDWAFGSAQLTVQPVHRVGFRDRIVMLDNVVTHSEVVQRDVAGEPDRLTFPVASVSERVLVTRAGGQEVSQLVTFDVLRVRMMTLSRIPGDVLRKGRDFSVTEDGRIDWTQGDRRGTAPTPGTGPHEPGGHYAITYMHRPSYLISNWPFAARTLHVGHKRPEIVHMPGPVMAFMLMEARQDHLPAGEPGA